jgi:hypothetical protein
MAQNPSRLIGSFVFRDEGDGCLTSKYHHEDSRECPFTEAAKLISKNESTREFIGSYRSVWLEDANTHIPAILVIEPHRLNTALFKLTWHEPDDPTDIIFRGSGMLYENLLVGSYWDENI